jgi:zinc transport system substrate-binding protein
MKQKITTTILSILLLGVLAISCASSPSTSSEQVNVTVSIVPQKYFVKRVGGEHVNVNIMVGPGDSPHTYEPKAEQMTALSDADVYFSIGVEFENAWMDRIRDANSEMLIVDLSSNLEKIQMASHHHEHEEDEESPDHEEEGTLDPHVWTSPVNAGLMAETIYETLADIDPDNETDYKANLEAFQKDISELNTEIKTTLEGLDSNRFMVFHPSWGYFARDFGLEQIPVEIEGSEPSAQELAGIIDEAKEENVKVIFGQPEFSTKTVDYIADEINGEVILISPLAEDWLENLRGVGNTFANVLKNK